MRLDAWEQIGAAWSVRVFRSRVPAGWLVFAGSDGRVPVSCDTLLVTDPEHQWRVGPQSPWEGIELPAGRLPGVGPRVRHLWMSRLAVPGGWLVLTSAPTLLFCPDPGQEWSGDATELEAADAPAGRGTELEAGSR